MKAVTRWIAMLILLAGAGVPLCPRAKKPEAIPFRFGESFRVMLVQGEVNGTRTWFVVDTGSNRTVINAKVAKVMALSLRERVRPAGGSGYVGNGAYLNATLKVGQREWRDRQIVVMDLEDMSKSMGLEVGGLLGMDFLNEFEVVVVNLRERTLVLQP